MPIYEYECPKCGCIKEELAPMEGEHKVICPKCAEGRGISLMKKIPSVPGGRFRYMDTMKSPGDNDGRTSE